MGIPSSIILCVFLLSFSSSQNSNVPRQCVIIQDKQKLLLPRDVPSFLTTKDKGICHTTDRRALQCGNTDVYIKPECVCSFYNVYEGNRHPHTACPSGQTSDDVTKLKCPDCLKYSLHNNGPCINGGNLTCEGEEVAPEIACDCPGGFSGMFCENQLIKVTRICDRIDNSSSLTLDNCTNTKRECLTYTETKQYVFKCNETSTEEEKQGNLPLCLKVETIIKTASTTTEGPRDQGTISSPGYRIQNEQTEQQHRMTSRAEALTSGPTLSVLTGLVLMSLL